MRTSSSLPPLQALRAFEAVGRLLSFRRAGEELLITQSAVSHHIRLLEDALGVRLFVRKPRGVALTPEGSIYLEKTVQAFRLMADATAQLRARARHSRVRVSLLPSFAANWLVARLQQFHALHPDIDLQLDPTLALADFAAGATDLAIRYGDGAWTGAEARLIVAEAVAPVISPRLLREGDGLRRPEDLLRHTLLLTRNPVDWTIWAEAAGLDLSSARTIQLTDYNIAIQAALDGQGVAMGRALLVRELLRSGRLVEPFAPAVTAGRLGHWLVTPKGQSPAPATRIFIDWLMRQANEDQGAGAGALAPQPA